MGVLKGDEIGRGPFPHRDSVRRLGCKCKTGPPAQITKGGEAPPASCSKSWCSQTLPEPAFIMLLKTKRKKKEKVEEDKKSKFTDERKSVSRMQRLRNFSAAARKKSRLRHRVLSSHLSFPTSSPLAHDCAEHPRPQAAVFVTLSNIPPPAVPQPDGDCTNKFTFTSPVSVVLGSCNGFIILHNVATST